MIETLGIFIIKIIHFIHRHRPGRKIDHVDGDLIGAETCKVFCHVGHVGVHQTYQNDNRSHADDNAQHCQKGAHLVAPDTLDGQLK